MISVAYELQVIGHFLGQEIKQEKLIKFLKIF